MVDHIDNRQQSKANCLKVVSLYGAIEGPVSMSINGKVRVFKGFSQVRQFFDTGLDRSAKLRSRDSDADFHDGKMMLDTGTGTVESELNTLDTDDTVFETALRELETSASQVATTLFESAQSVTADDADKYFASRCRRHECSHHEHPYSPTDFWCQFSKFCMEKGGWQILGWK